MNLRRRFILPTAGVAALACSLAACGTQPTATSTTAQPVERSTTSSTPTQQTGTPTPGPRKASVVMNGDLLWHNTLWFGAKEDAARAGRKGEDAMDFAPLLAGVRPVVEKADLAICHNEVPVAKEGGPYLAYPSFSAPPQTLTAVKDMGYDLCTTASNHSLDQGYAGLARTLDTMDRLGIQHVGTARSQEEADKPVIFTTADGVKIGVVEGAYDTNGIPLPEGKKWSWWGIDADSLLKRAKQTRAAGADIVLVSVHAGEEYANKPNSQQTELVKKLTASDDVDLVYGHHVHVPQPITKVNGKWVAYGLGNLVAQHKTDVPMGYEGITTRFTFTEDKPGKFTVSKAEYFPTLTTHYEKGAPARVMLVNDALAQGKGDQKRLKTAKERIGRVVDLLGGNEGLIEG